MTAAAVFEIYLKRLSVLYDRNEAAAITRKVMEDVAGMSPARLHSGEVVSPSVADDLVKILLRLEKGEPLQYILGYAWFLDMKLRVNSSVLIPRPETEELVAWILQNHQAEENVSVLDIGTGSGCIAMGLKKNLIQAGVIGLDISSEALGVAAGNAMLHNLEIQWIQGNILTDLDEAIPGGPFDILVSNPPYIPESDQETLHKNVLMYEPHEALFVPDEDPLLYYRCIVRRSRTLLKHSGAVYFELNPGHALEIGRLFDPESFRIRLKKDMSGRLRLLQAIRL